MSPVRIPVADLTRGFDREELIELAGALIAIPTFDGAEGEAIKFAERFLAGRDLATRLWARDPSRPNLVATIGKGTPVVALNGHLDTVPISDREAWATDPLVPTVKAGRLYGLGAIDMKAPAAVLMLAATHMRRYADQLKGTLQLQLAVDEETGAYNGTTFIIEQMGHGELERADFVISGERTDLKVSNAERGGLKFEVVFSGRAAHTADARTKGVNPIAHAARAVVALDRPLAEFHPHTGHGVISVNVIKGGSFASQVPDHCSILVDRRMVPGETADSVMAQAEAEIREALRDIPEARFQLRPIVDKQGRRRYYPPNLTAWESRLVQAALRAHKAVTGEDAGPCTGSFGASDGRLFRYQGIDTIAYGPSGENAHGCNEYVEIDTLQTHYKVLMATLSEILLEA